LVAHILAGSIVNDQGTNLALYGAPTVEKHSLFGHSWGFLGY